MTGSGETKSQLADESIFVAHCNANPVALVGHVIITLVSNWVILRWGVTGPKDKLNIVPEDQFPPNAAAPYRVFSDSISPAVGRAPSLFVCGPVAG